MPSSIRLSTSQGSLRRRLSITFNSRRSSRGFSTPHTKPKSSTTHKKLLVLVPSEYRLSVSAMVLNMVLVMALVPSESPQEQSRRPLPPQPQAQVPTQALSVSAMEELVSQESDLEELVLEELAMVLAPPSEYQVMAVVTELATVLAFPLSEYQVMELATVLAMASEASDYQESVDQLLCPIALAILLPSGHIDNILCPI